MAISTLNSHITAAIELQQKQTTAYFVIGKTSAWTNDSNPPEEVEDVSAISEVIGYKKTSKFSLTRPLKPGETPIYPTVTYAGQQWVLIPADKAYQEKARWIYAEAEITPEDFPTGNAYRQVGLHIGVVPKAGVTKQNLLPTDITSAGELRLYANQEPQTREATTYVTEQFVLVV